jgi:hypothetical protein
MFKMTIPEEIFNVNFCFDVEYTYHKAEEFNTAEVDIYSITVFGVELSAGYRHPEFFDFLNKIEL